LNKNTNQNKIIKINLFFGNVHKLQIVVVKFGLFLKLKNFNFRINVMVSLSDPSAASKMLDK